MRYMLSLLVVLSVFAVPAMAGDTAVLLDTSDGTSSMIVYDSNTTDLMRVQSDGLVGIGKMPSTNLDVAGAVKADLFIGNGSGLQNVTGIVPLNNVIWVATNGTPFGPGSIASPFGDVQAGYNAAAGQFMGQPAAILIGAGSYGPLNGVLNMWAGNVHVYGLSRPQLWSLIVSNAMPPTGIMGKQRVDNVVTYDLQVYGSHLKCHRVRAEEGLIIYGSATNVEFQDCYFTTPYMDPAVRVMSGASIVGFYNSSMEGHENPPTLNIQNNVSELEIIGCEIVKTLSNTVVIVDGQVNTINPLHLYSHNYIKGMGDMVAIQDSAGVGQTTIAFHQNMVFGDVGTVAGQLQRHSNNTIYGVMNWGAPDGGGMIDAYGNAIFNKYRNLPDSWND